MPESSIKCRNYTEKAQIIPEMLNVFGDIHKGIPQKVFSAILKTILHFKEIFWQYEDSKF